MSAAGGVLEDRLGRKPRILCVDDEPNILASLRRLFRPYGYEVLVAESGYAGLQMLEEDAVDVVISDMRMPEMDGTQFLESVRARWPDSVRMLLTGYADIQLILGAINRGEIYRYVTKPWDDNDILMAVRHAMERKALEEDKRRLEALTFAQNEELKELNADLEGKVAQRTAELQVSNEKLKNNFLTSIKIFSNMIELRGANLAGHSRRVADLARKIAQRLGLDGREVQDIFVAGLLHNIGKIGFSDDLLAIPVALMNGENLGKYQKYPVRGEQLLMPLEDLHETARIVRSHQERFDGEGYPDKLAGLDIPLGARVVALASDYDNLQIGTFTRKQFRPSEAAELVIKSRSTRYDPEIVLAFQDITLGRTVVETQPEMPVTVAQLVPGMIMARDLIGPDGSLLLAASYPLSERLIAQIADFELLMGTRLTLYIRPEQNS